LQPKAPKPATTDAQGRSKGESGQPEPNVAPTPQPKAPAQSVQGGKAGKAKQVPGKQSSDWGADSLRNDPKK
jgi:hypothetical protein